jgi:hypothetical protein
MAAFAALASPARVPEVAELRLDVYGLRISVAGAWPEVVDAIRSDFAWFERPVGPGESDVDVIVERAAPDWDAYGDLRAASVDTSRVRYRDGERTIVDHVGRAVSEIDRGGERLTIRGEDAQVVHAAVYFFLLGRAGAHVEALGMPRVHGLGIAGAQGAVVVLLPSGGGKSTLGMRVLRHDGVRLLSDDSPLIDRRGRVHPFPLRVALARDDAAGAPGGNVRRIERVGARPKIAIDMKDFAHRIEPRSLPLAHVVIGRRSLGREGRLEPLPRRRGGTLMARMGKGATRSVCCAAGLARARVWRLTLGRDHDANLEALLPLLG